MVLIQKAILKTILGPLIGLTIITQYLLELQDSLHKGRFLYLIITINQVDDYHKYFKT